MMNPIPSGAFAGSPFRQTPDPTVRKIESDLSVLETDFPHLRTASDPYRTGILAAAAAPFPTHTGYIVQTSGHTGWYRVQLGGLQGTVGCCSLMHGGGAATGARPFHAYGPGTLVLVHKPPKADYGIIMGALPPRLRDDKLHSPDFLVQGGAGGVRRSDWQRFLFTGMVGSGGLVPFSCNRPRDLLGRDFGFVTPTGIMFSISDSLAQFRIDENTGLWLSRVDGFARLAARDLLIESPAWELATCNDEGESGFFSGHALYPWEALGLSAPGPSGTKYGTGGDSAAFRDQDDARRGTGKHAAVDLPEGEEDAAPFYRREEYRGYLGQGGLETLSAPGNSQGRNTYSNPFNKTGLYANGVAADGEVGIWSAKALTIGKRPDIPSFVRIKPQAADGDSRAAGGYSFSGMGGTPHAVGDPGGNLQSGKEAAGDDLSAYALHWKMSHPFRYHVGDFAAPRPGDIPAARESIDYSTLSRDSLLSAFTPAIVRIDHRYTSVAYYRSLSYLRFEDDGGVSLVDGYGSRLLMAKGVLRLDAPNIELAAGKTLALTGSQVIVKAEQAVDISSANGGVRVKAETDLQFLSGNGGTGSILFENKAVGGAYDFEAKVGDEVQSSGIIFKASRSTVGFLSDSAYIRTLSGDVTIDANQGRAAFRVAAASSDFFMGSTFSIYFGPGQDTNDVRKVMQLSASAMIVETPLLAGDSFTMYGDNKDLLVSGSVYVVRNVIAGGEMTKRTAGEVAETPEGTFDEVKSQAESVRTTVTSVRDAGTSLHGSEIKAAYRVDGTLGGADTIQAMGFSYRDRVDQYRTEEFSWFQPRWESLVDAGAATGGRTWVEKPVLYQGARLFPWPGREAWEGPSSYIGYSPSFIDGATGEAADMETMEAGLAGTGGTHSMAAKVRVI